MKIFCSQPLLTKALNTVSKAVSSRTTIPVLKGILLRATDAGELYLMASDMDLTIETKIPVTVEEPGTAVVSARLFGDIIRKLPSETIEITVGENNQIQIRCKKSDFSIVGMDPADFPQMVTVEETETAELEKKMFRSLIQKTAFSASIEESKGIIVGVLVEIGSDGVTMAALDGFRMAVCRENAEGGDPRSIVISAKILSEVAKIISDSGEEGKMKMSMDDKKAVFVLGDTKIVARLMEGEFIRYKDILPKAFSTDIVINREEMLSSIERASLLAKEGKNNLVRLTLEEDKMVITSRSEEGNVREEAAAKREGDGLEIGFNSKYLQDAIKVIEDEEIRIGFNNPVSPCLIRPMEGNGYEYLVLPVRIAGK